MCHEPKQHFPLVAFLKGPPDLIAQLSSPLWGTEANTDELHKYRYRRHLLY